MAKLSVNWSRVRDKADLNPALIRYTRYLETKGFKKNTIILYTKLINNYLLEVSTDLPTAQDAINYRDSLHDKKLSGSAINNFTAAIINYHRMIDQPVKLPFLKLNNSLPYYFDETDILKIFSACSNLKHYCMLKVLFFGCLRSGELCKLNVPDYDPDDLTLRLRETKNASDAIAFINDETARELNKYLQIKPKLEIDGYEPLFITDYCHRWTPTRVLQMFMNYKEKRESRRKEAFIASQDIQVPR